VKRLRILAIIAQILLLALSLSGCVERFTGDSTEPGTPKVLTPEDIEAIFASVTVDEIDKYPTETDTAGNEIVYWLKGGEVWHSSKFCGSISRAEPDAILQGTIADAMVAGKKRACKTCSDGDESSSADTSDVIINDTVDTTDPVSETELAVDGETIVYWLKNGTVWHLDSNCRSLAGSDKSSIISGALKDAYSHGKERGCKNCASEVIVYFTYSETTTSVITDVASEVITDKYPIEYGEDGNQIVFWLESSKIWHLSRHCSSLSRTDPSKLISGSIDEAIKAGKERACKNCS
jgi:hypothetical protein